MLDEAEISVLRRKAGVGRAAPDLAAMTPARGMRLAAARAGDEVLHIPVALRDLAEAALLSEDLAKALPDPALIMQLNGPEGARGLAVFCPNSVAAIIEAQTMGRVLSTAATARTPTRTDAVMVSEFLDQMLIAAAVLVIDCADPPPISGFLCGAALTDARAGAMILQDGPHKHFTAEFDFAAGAKQGKLHLVLPAGSASHAGTAADPAAWAETLHHSVLGTTARLEAVLCHITLPLSRVVGLAVGDTLPLAPATLDKLALKGPTGATVITGRLGRAGPMRAVRLTFPDKARIPMAALPQAPKTAEPEKAKPIDVAKSGVED